jgi:hypothetical protein
MRVVAEVRGWRVVPAAERRAGGGRAGDAAPRAGPERAVVLDARIEYGEDGYLLSWLSYDGAECAEEWHQSLADAQAQAESELGIPKSAWRPR